MGTKHLAISSGFSFRMRGVIVSGPGAFPIFSPSINLVIPFHCISRVSALGVLLHRQSNSSIDASAIWCCVLYTDVKNEFNSFAITVGLSIISPSTKD